MATIEQMKATIAEATAFFGARDELAVLEQAILRIIQDGLNEVDWRYLAEEIVDAVRGAITDARDGETLLIGRLRSRLEDIETLPEPWWDQSHPIHKYIAEFVDERRDLRWFFDEFEHAIAEEDYTTVYPDWQLGTYVLQLVCKQSGTDVENLDPALRASINKRALIEHFKKNGGKLQGVEFLGANWLLGQ